MKTFSFALIPAALLCASLFAFTPESEDVKAIDHVIARPAYNRVMPIGESDYRTYHANVRERLDYITDLLDSRDVSDWPAELRAARATNIELLRDYRERGAFPINYDYPNTQLPCFYDRDGNLCAVANLIAQSDGIEMVEKINAQYKYATVSQMEMPELDAWIARSGLTRAEVITIQEPGWNGGFERAPRQPFQIATVDTTAAQQVVEPVRTEPVTVEPVPTQVEPATPQTTPAGIAPSFTLNP